jgi:hypothetical protein
MTFVEGCLLPPSSGEDLIGPYPPKVDLTKLFPRKPKNRLDPSQCQQSLRVEISDVVDLDTNTLLFRWVANNAVESTIFIDDDESSQTPGDPHASNVQLFHDAAFEPPANGTRTGVLSLFITDAPAWADPNPVVPRGESDDLSAVAPDENGSVTAFTVLEVRWTFEYVAGLGSCTAE